MNTSFKSTLFVLIALAITLAACGAPTTPEGVARPTSIVATAYPPATMATEEPSRYKVMVTVNDVRVYSGRFEEEIEFLFILNLSYYDIAVCPGGGPCAEQYEAALDGYWPSTLDYLGPFPYEDVVEVWVKSWWTENEFVQGDCTMADTGLVEYRCTPGTLVKYTINYDATRHTKEEDGRTVAYINLPYLSVRIQP